MAGFEPNSSWWDTIVPTNPPMSGVHFSIYCNIETMHTLTTASRCDYLERISQVQYKAFTETSKITGSRGRA